MKAATELDKEVGCVIASFDFHCSYIKLVKAISYLNNPEVIFLATDMDERFNYSKDVVLPGKTLPIDFEIKCKTVTFLFLKKGAGSMVMSIVTASRRQPKILGKPETFIFEAVTKEFPDIKPERSLMIGDTYVTYLGILPQKSIT